ncbi:MULTISPECIES: restriction endonuclease [Serratia]|jgi:restriction system protein|uniref:restriction endonuclease n=1 Tax=Serratia TaxID=613 RepID=UPI000B610DA2|nr:MULTISPECIES: restriction endonuclease [Serratia]KAB5496864.1 restriction endonuclease [Enterobacter sp. RJAL6]ASL90445.1 restriction endonuclease [Serratia marcescens]ASM04036.1 restriction endonuclease [Serratia marcescens]ELI8816538.1 restriction endonuclease [Serratia marcescens]ELI8846454.1 restriction endonuclease [Serratia marcescens]
MMSPQHVGIALMANPVLAVLLTGLFIAVMAGLNLRGRESASVRRHRRYRATAARVLQRLPQLGGNGQRLAYLRKINPYVFEELLLLAFERQGYAVIRNTSYSGDGGLDGQVIIEGKTYFIQAKRYGRAITPSHIKSFGALLRHHHCDGFFIHTGRTGQLSHALLQNHPHVHLVSGQKLLALLAGNTEWMFFLTVNSVTNLNDKEGRHE